MSYRFESGAPYMVGHRLGIHVKEGLWMLSFRV